MLNFRAKPRLRVATEQLCPPLQGCLVADLFVWLIAAGHDSGSKYKETTNIREERSAQKQ